MRLLLFYSIRNLATRRLTTALTASGMALVVFAFASILMLAEGLQKTLVETGSHENVVVIRRSAGTEVQSGIERLPASIVETNAYIALGERGERLVAKELVVLVNLQKKGSNSPSNVIIRGISEESLTLRPQVRILTGRLPKPGSSEIMIGRSIATRFKNAEITDTLFFAQRTWTIVGVFDAGSTGFSSEIWGDAVQLMQAFRRPVYSSIILKLADSAQLQALKEQIEGDPRLQLEAKRETTYYEEQSAALSAFLRILGTSLTIVFSFGAIVGALITMHSAVASRVSEIGTLRALGFQKSAILSAFLLESLALGFLGGLAGLFFASFLQLFTVSTMNFQTFSELSFSFTLTGELIVKAMGFSLFMGLAGGILPAIRASRMKIVEALREA